MPVCLSTNGKMAFFASLESVSKQRASLVTRFGSSATPQVFLKVQKQRSVKLEARFRGLGTKIQTRTLPKSPGFTAIRHHFVVPLPALAPLDCFTTNQRVPGGQSCTKDVSFSAPWRRWFSATPPPRPSPRKWSACALPAHFSWSAARSTGRPARSRKSEKHLALAAWRLSMQCRRTHRERPSLPPPSRPERKVPILS